jgi:hypothetical protein
MSQLIFINFNSKNMMLVAITEKFQISNIILWGNLLLKITFTKIFIFIYFKINIILIYLRK